jgi:hypothetical protein
MSKIPINDKLDSIRGEIISSALRIEFILAYKLRKYFHPINSEKSTILFWNVLNTRHLRFDDKIGIYESIPYFKKLKSYKKVAESLRFIQKRRNEVAHWELDEKESTLENIVIYTLVGKYKKITINNNLIEQYKKHIDFLLKHFGYNK